AVFYLPHARLWELLLGGLLAYAELFHKDAVTSFTRRVLFRVPEHADDRFIAALKAGAGLTLIAIAIVMLGNNSAFPGSWFSVKPLHPVAAALGLANGAAYPGWWATLPVVGTALIIWAGAGAWINRAVLGHRLLVYIGLISYPLYLWHWPLLSFLRITEGAEPPRGLRAAAVAMAFVLAAATYAALAPPIRRTVGWRTPLRLALVASSLVVIAATALAGYRT